MSLEYKIKSTISLNMFHQRNNDFGYNKSNYCIKTSENYVNMQTAQPQGNVLWLFHCLRMQFLDCTGPDIHCISNIQQFVNYKYPACIMKVLPLRKDISQSPSSSKNKNHYLLISYNSIDQVDIMINNLAFLVGMNINIIFRNNIANHDNII